VADQADTLPAARKLLRRAANLGHAYRDQKRYPGRPPIYHDIMRRLAAKNCWTTRTPPTGPGDLPVTALVRWIGRLENARRLGPGTVLRLVVVHETACPFPSGACTCQDPAHCRLAVEADLVETTR
jgi:hypothetical protein